jgi:cell division protein FtsB
LSQVASPYWIKRGYVLSKARSAAAARERSNRLARAVVIMTGLVLVAACLSFYRQTRLELNAARAKKQGEVARLEQLQIEAERLEMLIDRLRNDQRLIESLARHDLGLIGPGDVVVKIDGGHASALPPGPPPQEKQN